MLFICFFCLFVGFLLIIGCFVFFYARVCVFILLVNSLRRHRITLILYCLFEITFNSACFRSEAFPLSPLNISSLMCSKSCPCCIVQTCHRQTQSNYSFSNLTRPPASLLMLSKITDRPTLTTVQRRSRWISLIFRRMPLDTF